MPIGQTNTAQNNSAGPASVTINSAASGSSFLVVVSWDVGLNFTSITDLIGGGASGNSFTQIGSEVSNIAGIYDSRSYYVSGGFNGGTNHEFRVALSGTGYWTISVTEITNVDTSTPITGTPVFALDASSPFASAGVTTAVANAMLVGFAASDSFSNPATFAADASASPTSGWTLQTGATYTNGSVNYTLGVITQAVTATGTYNSAFTVAGASNNAVGLIAFRDATGGQTLTQTSRFNNTNSFPAGSVLADQTLVQATRFTNVNTFFEGELDGGVTVIGDLFIVGDDTNYSLLGGDAAVGGEVTIQTLVGTLFTNTNTFYAGTVTQPAGGQTLVQTARFDNSNTFNAGQVNLRLSGTRFNNTNSFFAGQVNLRLIGTRFDNSNTFFTGTANLRISGTRFDNTNTFFGGVVNQAGGTQTLVQSSRFDNTNSFFAGTTLIQALQASRFNNTNQFYNGAVALRLSGVRFDNTNTFFDGLINLRISQNTRFDNSNSFFAGTVVASSGPQTLTQSSRFNNTSVFYAGQVITPGTYTTSFISWG